MKKSLKIISFIFVLLMVLATGASASTPYSTYTYSILGETMSSPHAYVPDVMMNSASLGLEVPLSQPTDIEADKDGNIYITDKGNNRIVVTDKYYEVKYIISDFVNEHGVDDRMNSPTSTFVVNDGDCTNEECNGLYVCDTFNSRLLVFDLETGEYVKSIAKPESELFGADARYSPISCVVDKYGSIYVVSQDTTEGIIVMTSRGEFINFIGAPKVTVSALDALKQMISPGAANNLTFVPTTYISLDIDMGAGQDQGGELIYATIIFTSDDHSNQEAQLVSKSSDYSPVRLLNAKGADIMNRNGFFAPSGEVAVMSGVTKTASNKDTYTGVSNIADVTSGPNGVWSIIDSERSKIYTYDHDGNLLYAFGDKGVQLGNVQGASAITYQGTNIIVLDGKSNSFTVYRRTDYGDLLDQAIYYQNQRDFDTAVEYWREVLTRNNNFDTAYVAIGKAYYRSGEYEKAIEYYQNAYDTENYATAFKEVRKEKMEKMFIFLIIGIIVVVILLAKLFKYVGKVNKRAQHKTGRRTLWEELLYGFHLMFHPFDGYWDLKHENRGSVRASIIFIALTILAFFYQSFGTGYYSNPLGNAYSGFFAQITSILSPLFLWIISNWCFTTLFDGEGSFKDIFIATSYALFPVPALVIISTILTNVFVGSETQICTMLISIAYIWMGFLIVIGMQVTHDYSMGKNILTIIATIVGMVIIMFIALLFTTLIQKMVALVTTIISELSYR